MTDTILTQERLKELLHYNPETGIFTWKISPRANVKSGNVAGYSAHGHIQITIDRKAYMSHRLAWLYVHGTWPIGQIDHINCIKTDNRIINLRDVSHSVNMQNIHNPQKNNSCNYRGVYFFKPMNKYASRIRANGKSYFLGYFDKAEDAGMAYVKAKSNLHINR